MKKLIVLSAFLILVLSGLANAQTSSAKVVISESVERDGSRTAFVRYPASENRNFLIFEAKLPEPTTERCLESSDLSNAQPVSPDRASLTFDPFSGTYLIKWTIGPETENSCRVLSVGTSASASDFNLWRANFGQTSLAEQGKDGSNSLLNQHGPVTWGIDRVDQRD